jgi:hypothetical protein
MAAVQITINGTQTDEMGTRQVTIIGAATLTGLGIGGGPMPPGSGGGGGGNFPNIPPHPEHPIVGGPGVGGGQPGFPPGIGGGPIYPTDPPVEPPEDQSKIEWHAAWTQEDGWVTVGIIKPEGPHPTPSGGQQGGQGQQGQQ